MNGDLNPEFERNLWLEFGARRLVWTGVVLALVYGVVLLTTADDGFDTRAGAMRWTGLAIFLLCGVLWASRAAGGAVLTEIGQRTWDFQRLSALTPWQMTWGKLAGAASLAGVSAATGLVVMGLFSLIDPPSRTTPFEIPILVALAVFSAAASMTAALVGVRKARAEGRVAQARAVWSGVIVGTFLLISFSRSAPFLKPNGYDFFGPHGALTWWGARIDWPLFAFLSLAAFAAWALVGAWRLMRLELQMRNGPFVWAAFVLFAALWTAGFGAAAQQRWLIAATLCAMTCYGAAFAEPADKVRMRQFAGAVRGSNWTLAQVAWPGALTSLILTLLAATGAAVNIAGIGSGVTVFAWIAFLVRDLGVIAYFRFGPRPQRGDISAVVALAVLYGVLGLLGGPLFSPDGHALFSPVSGNAAVSLLSGLVQAGLAWWLAARRIGAPEPSLPSRQD